MDRQRKAGLIDEVRTDLEQRLALPAVKTAALRLAFGSCQQYEQGYYTAMRHMAGEDLNALLFLGDYIYEASWGRDLVRRHTGGRPTTLDEYRDRYALYKSDKNLQAAHAAHPWILTWDDHEVSNDYAGATSGLPLTREAFLTRRAAAYQAYYEYLPLRLPARPHGPDARLYRRLSFGPLLQLYVLDTRQFRSPQACVDDPPIGLLQ